MEHIYATYKEDHSVPLAQSKSFQNSKLFFMGFRKEFYNIMLVLKTAEEVILYSTIRWCDRSFYYYKIGGVTGGSEWGRKPSWGLSEWGGSD